jgi:hypothetical protein
MILIITTKYVCERADFTDGGGYLDCFKNLGKRTGLEPAPTIFYADAITLIVLKIEYAFFLINYPVTFWRIQ